MFSKFMLAIRIVAVLIATIFLSVPNTVLAADFIVNDEIEFRDALFEAERNDQDDTIHLAAAVFFTKGVPFIYIAEDMDTLEENFALTIKGAGKNSTVLDAGGLSEVLFISTLDLVNDNVSHITVRDLTIRGAVSPEFALGIETIDGDITADNVLFTDNDTVDGAFAAFSFNGDIYVLNSMFTLNDSTLVAGALILTDNSNVKVEKTMFEDNFGLATAISTLKGDIALYDNVYIINGSDFAGAADLVNEEGDITLMRNLFHNNSSEVGPGALNVTNFIGFNYLMDNTFRYNNGVLASAVAIDNFTNEIVLVNNAMFGNTSPDGLGGTLNIVTSFGPVTLTNNTISENVANGGGLAVFLLEDAAVLKLYNNIIWGNVAQGVGEDIFIHDDIDGNARGSIIEIFNNDFDDLFIVCEFDIGCDHRITMAQNISLDPLFVDPFNGNLRLLEGSPAIDEGETLAPFLPMFDINGNERTIDGDTDGNNSPDMGAYEFIPDPMLFPIRSTNGCSLALNTVNAASFINVAILLILPALIAIRRRFFG